MKYSRLREFSLFHLFTTNTLSLIGSSILHAVLTTRRKSKKAREEDQIVCLRNINHSQYEINESITMILMTGSRYYWDSKPTRCQGKALHPNLQVRHRWGRGAPFPNQLLRCTIRSNQPSRSSLPPGFTHLLIQESKHKFFFFKFTPLSTLIPRWYIV